MKKIPTIDAASMPPNTAVPTPRRRFFSALTPCAFGWKLRSATGQFLRNVVDVGIGADRKRAEVVAAVVPLVDFV